MNRKPIVAVVGAVTLGAAALIVPGVVFGWGEPPHPICLDGVTHTFDTEQAYQAFLADNPNAVVGFCATTTVVTITVPGTPPDESIPDESVPEESVPGEPTTTLPAPPTSTDDVPPADEVPPADAPPADEQPPADEPPAAAPPARAAPPATTQAPPAQGGLPATL